MDSMDKPTPVLIGFFPKETYRPPEGPFPPVVKEICSVSTCISDGPKGWIDTWKHSDPWGLFDTEGIARSVIGGDVARFDVYAYRMFPTVFDKGGAAPIHVTALNSGLDGFDFLGYDMVSRSSSSFFECSPLSCSGDCGRYQVNRYCLIDDLETAWQAALEIAADNTSEPGPYYLLEVWRKRR
jgi:hypothetical protein